MSVLVFRFIIKHKKLETKSIFGLDWAACTKKSIINSNFVHIQHIVITYEMSDD